MAVAVASTPAAPRAAIDVCRIDVTGATVNDPAGYDVAAYPTEPEIKYSIAFVKAGVVEGRSYQFGVSSDGKHQFNDFIFPSAGSWTVSLRKVIGDSQVASVAVTVG